MDRRKFFLLFIVFLFLLGCTFPTELAMFLPLNTPVKFGFAPNNLVSLPGPTTLTPFLPVESIETNLIIPSLTDPFLQSVTETMTLTQTVTGSPSYTEILILSPTSTSTEYPSNTLTLYKTATFTSSPTRTRTLIRTSTLTSTQLMPDPTISTGTPSPSATPSSTRTSTPTPSRTNPIPTMSTTTIPPSATFSSTPTRSVSTTPTATVTFTKTSSCSPVYNSAFELQLYSLINNERKNAGLTPLVASYPLEISSGEHSLDMAINNFISHTGSDGSSYWTREVRAGYTGRWGGEIIYAGSGAYNSPESAVKWWMEDPPHKAVILGDYDDMGAGYAYCSTSIYGGFYTVDFGHR